jgi:crotonobetainyl-CoA:carnitine CoA-transferase CaiB-like acyl-CoA transferase
MRRWCAEHSTEAALEILGREKIPAAKVLRPQEVLEDPQVRAMGFFAALDYPGLPRPAPVAKAPVFLSATPGEIRHRAPLLGEHTDAVLAELGYDPAAIAALREKRVV